MKDHIVLKIVLMFVALIAVSFWGWNYLNKNANDVISNNIVFDTKILGDYKDLVSFSIDSGSSVSGALTAVGSVSGGYFFEGNILVNILDSNKKVIKKGNGSAKTDWMTMDPVGFETIIDFTNLPKGNAFIEIHNDNPGAPTEGVNKSILIPIIIK
ncbi:MAG: hypothetical protein NTU81_01160 [Candidatus Nomurabacteria bacterium]|nr:hypothetical protein [Candidatus Nomurabacteria bacterium]